MHALRIGFARSVSPTTTATQVVVLTVVKRNLYMLLLPVLIIVSGATIHLVVDVISLAAVIFTIIVRFSVRGDVLVIYLAIDYFDHFVSSENS